MDEELAPSFQVADIGPPQYVLPLDKTDPMKTITPMTGRYHGNTQECVGIARSLGLPHHSEWRDGGTIADDTPYGTPIATINPKTGRYDSTYGGNSHVGLYMGKDADGSMIIFDQARNMPAGLSRIPYDPKATRAERDAGRYKIITTAADMAAPKKATATTVEESDEDFAKRHGYTTGDQPAPAVVDTTQADTEFAKKHGYVIPPAVPSTDAYEYIPPGAPNVPQPIVGPVKRVTDSLVRSLQGPYGPADLPADYTNPVGRYAYGAIQKPMMAVDYLSRPLIAGVNGLGALYAGMGEKTGMMDRPTADSAERDLNLLGTSALALGATRSTTRSRGDYMPPAVKVEPAPPLATHEPAVIGGGYLKGGAMPPEGSFRPVEPVQPATPSPVPAESTVGAAQTPSGSGPTMGAAEARARQARNERSQLEQTDTDRRVGGIETHQHVPDVRMTLGRIDLSHAAEEGALRDMFPKEFEDIRKANNTARIDHVEKRMPDPIAIHNMTEAREAQRLIDIQPMKENPKPVDLKPVSDLIDKHLAEGGEDRGLIASTLTAVKKTLSDADGNLRTDPMRVYNGARKNITDMLDRAKADPKSNEATSQAHLVEIKEALDKAISDTNPAFRRYLDNYSKASGPIDEAELLADVRKRITNAAGEVQLGRVDAVLNSIDTMRNTNKGANKGKHVTDETLQALYDIRNDLQAEDARAAMSRSVGSNTHLKILQGEKYKAEVPSVMKNALSNALEVGLTGTAHLVDPSYGFATNALTRMSADALGRRRIAKATAQAEKMTAAQESAQKARLQQFLNPQHPQLGHNGGPPME